MTQATSFWVESPGRAVLRATDIPDPAPGDVLVRTMYTGISRGTESLVYRGEVPSGEHERMRAPFQEGDFPGPVKYGYLNVGVVEWGPDDLRGRPVFTLFPHSKLPSSDGRADATATRVPGQVSACPAGPMHNVHTRARLPLLWSVWPAAHSHGMGRGRRRIPVGTREKHRRERADRRDGTNRGQRGGAGAESG